jgi:murein DD-endopeptidase MepM/ murein hydrolase activator NlpD
MSETPGFGRLAHRRGGSASREWDALGVKSGALGADDSLMADEGQRRSSRRRFLGTMFGGACACGLVVAASPLAHAQGSIASLDEPGTALRTAERLSLRPPPVPEGKLMFPVSAASGCYVLDNFGDARGERLHQGVDIMGLAGQPVFAVASGVLKKRYTNTGTAGWGWTLYDESTDTTYQYFHLTEDPVGLVQGSSVTAGQTIGYVGNSGTFGENNFHLHFEVRPDNVAVDPLPLLAIDSKVCKVSPPLRA